MNYSVETTEKFDREFKKLDRYTPVSYTHLDVYKRQMLQFPVHLRKMDKIMCSPKER